MADALGALLRPFRRLDDATDETLVARAAGGDVGAFEALYDRYVADVYAYVRVRVGSDELAEDLTQDTFVSAYGGLARFEWRGALRPWLIKCARNRVANHWRTVARRPVTVPLADTDPPALAAAVRNGTDPLERAAAALDQETVLGAIGRLSDAQREVIALRFSLELSVAETAHVMGRTESAVKNLQYAALGGFRRALLAEEEST